MISGLADGSNYIRSFAYPLIIAFIISGCSIEKKCNRLHDRNVRSAKYCRLVRTDTLTVRDTVYLGTVRKDSTFVMSREVDTFYLNHDRLHVRVIREFDTLRITGQCDSVFIIKEIHVPYEYVEVKEIAAFWRSAGRWGRRLIWLAVIVAAGALVYKHRGKIPLPWK